MAVAQDVTQGVTDFLYKEAQVLDEGRYPEWLDLLTYDVQYQVPVRFTKERDPAGDAGGMTGIDEDMYHLDEDRTSLEMRVERIATGFAWCEDPPSRLRHFVTNIRVEAVPGTEHEVRVRSNVLVFRSRWDRPDSDLLSAERFDVLRWEDGAWKLARRKVILDNTTVPTLNLSFFF